MEKFFSLSFSAKRLPRDNSIVAYRIELQTTELADWIAHLCLLSNHHIDSIVLNSADNSLKLALSGNKGIYPSIINDDGIPKLILPAKLLNSVINLYLSIYQDGKTGIEHLDIEVYRVEKKLPCQTYYFTFM
jgi:hypothetical protein